MPTLPIYFDLAVLGRRKLELESEACWDGTIQGPRNEMLTDDFHHRHAPLRRVRRSALRGLEVDFRIL